MSVSQELVSTARKFHFVTALLFILHDPVFSYHAGHSFSSTSATIRTRFSGSTRLYLNPKVDHALLSVDDAWEDHYNYYISDSAEFQSCLGDEERQYISPSHSYVSHLVRAMNVDELDAFFVKQQRTGQPLLNTESIQQPNDDERKRPNKSDAYFDEPHHHLRVLRQHLPDPLWSQIRLEAQHALTLEPDAGSQLYQHVLRQPSMMDALACIISHEISTELMPATALQTLVLDQLQMSDDKNIYLDLIASVNRNPSEDTTALTALLFHQGLHALVCYRVAHRLWQAGRTGLAMFIQSTVSTRYAADIHPAAKIEGGIYLSVGGGVVIGETARVGHGVTILQGVTLGGTGKEVGDRHPKVEDGVILHSGAAVLGNLRVGKGAVVTAKSIVTKEVPDLARVSGVPATVKSYRDSKEECILMDDDEDDENEECGVDCEMIKLYESYFEQLEALVEMELHI